MEVQKVDTVLPEAGILSADTDVHTVVGGARNSALRTASRNRSKINRKFPPVDAVHLFSGHQTETHDAAVNDHYF